MLSSPRPHPKTQGVWVWNRLVVHHRFHTRPHTAAATGFVTGALISPITCPLEGLKVRAQGSQPLFARTGRGVFGSVLFAGWTATVLRCSVGNAAFFGSYALLTAHRRSDTGASGGALGAARVVAAGGVSGVAFWTVAMPFDVVKTRQQLHAAQQGAQPTVTELLSSIGRTPSALWRGFVPAALRAMPMNAAVFAVFECSNSAILKLVAEKEAGL